MTEIEKAEWILSKMTSKQKKHFVAGYYLKPGNLNVMCGKDHNVTISKKKGDSWENFSLSLNEFLMLGVLEADVFEIYNPKRESPKYTDEIPQELDIEAKVDRLYELYEGLAMRLERLRRLIQDD